MILPILVGLALAQTPKACQLDCATPYGSEIGRSAGVVARSNCSVECVNPTPIMSAHPDHPEGVYTGIGWQCVEYARRAWLGQHGRVFASVDTAAEMWTVVRRIIAPGGDQAVEVSALANGGAQSPQAGDLIIYAADPSQRALRFGHVALVVGVEDGMVQLAEQNWSNAPWPQAGFSRALKLSGEPGSVQLNDSAGTVLGWLRVLRPAQ